MCEYCHSFPHLPGCPNASAPRATHECAYCGEGIYPGEYYAKVYGPKGLIGPFGDSYYHWDCLLGMDWGEIMDLLDMDNGDLLDVAGVEMKECEEDDE